MTEPLLNRFKQWLCKVFGHLNLDKDNSWDHGGRKHTTCLFCLRIESIKQEKQNERKY